MDLEPQRASDLKVNNSSVYRPGMRAAITAALLALLPAACASNSLDQQNTVVGPPMVTGKSLVGNYLAGRHAQAERDLSKAADLLKTALGLDPKNEKLLRRVFVVMVAEGRMNEAMTLAKRLYDAEAEAPIAHIALAVDDIRRGKFERAIDRLDTLPKGGINAFMTPLLKSWALVGAKETEAALEALKPLADKKTSKPLHDLHAALVNEWAGRVEAAEINYKAVLSGRAGQTLRVIDLFTAFYDRTGRPEKAVEVYRDSIKKRPQSASFLIKPGQQQSGKPPPLEINSARAGSAEALLGLASSLRQQNAREMALLFGRMALYLKPDFPVAQYLVASILESDQRLDKANQTYRGIKAASPFAWTARMNIAANLDQMGRTEEAIGLFSDLSSQKPTDADSLINLGDIFRRHDRFPEAVTAYDKAFKRINTLGRQHWSLLYSRGIALERSKQWPRAEKDFLKALEFVPEQPYVLNYLGYSWIEKGVNLEKALDMIKKAVSLRPTDGYIVDSLGWVYYRLGNIQKAVKELERAVIFRPEDPVINDHLGDAYWRIGRRHEARFQWQRALTLKPEDAALIDTIKDKIRNGLKPSQAPGKNG